MIGAGIAFNPCCKCDEKAKCNICELTYRRNGQLLHHADVVEVRHSHWVVCGAFDDFLKCSSCGYDLPWQTAIEHKYCPECGAKMDGERSTKDAT